MKVCKKRIENSSKDGKPLPSSKRNNDDHTNGFKFTTTSN